MPAELLHRDRPRDRRHGQDLRRHLRDASQPHRDPGALVFRFGEFLLTERPDRPGRPDRAVTTTPSTTSVGLDWADNGEADLAGYDVYRAANPEGPYTKITASPISASSYTDTGLTSGTLYAYQVRALDGSGNVSAASAAATALPDAASPPAVTFPVQVNFQSETAPIPTGYTRDFGQNYANVRGFGWVVPGTATPRSLVGNGRDRNDADVTDQRLDTFMHMQGNNVTNFANVALPGAWEIAVPNGTYSVEVSVGEPNASARPDVHTTQRRRRQRHHMPSCRPAPAGSARGHAPPSGPRRSATAA